MRSAFEERTMDEVERSRDAEFTLGPNSLMAIFFGLIALCGVCFGLGYATGHRETPLSAELPHAANTETAIAAATTGRPKPSAAPQPEPAPTADGSTAADMPVSADPDSDIVSGGATAQGANPATAAAPSTAPTSNQWVVKPAMPAQPVQPSTTPGSTLATAPAMAVPGNGVPGNGVMVQIAAVSHSEDADVLVSALRRRGYAVSVRRDLGDGLLHVQIGPFANRNDANTMKMKLLNDGYNAIVQP
jgi:DedD protein